MWGFSDFFIGLVAGLFGGGVLASVVFALCFVVSICEREQASVARSRLQADAARGAAEPEQDEPVGILSRGHHLSSTA